MKLIEASFPSRWRGTNHAGGFDHQMKGRRREQTRSGSVVIIDRKVGLSLVL